MERTTGNSPQEAQPIRERVLLHTCCAPCSIACVADLRGSGVEPTAFWYNPNIHPFTEYRQRLNTLRGYAASIGMALVERNEYGLRTFLTEVDGAFDARCPVCYRLRLDAAAAYAVENGFPAFSTTLLISPYQNHALLMEAGERSAATVLGAMKQLIEAEPLARIDYVEMVSWDGIKPVETVDGPVLVAMAVYIGKTRLIDNFIFGE